MTDQTVQIHPRIYQLDELLSDVYNAVYAKSNKYVVKYIDIGNLNMIRFKLTDYDLDEIFSKTKIAFGGKYPTGMKNNGKEIEQIWIKRKGDIHMSTIRIVPYSNSDTINDMSDPINVNLIVRTLLSELVVSEKTNNILLPIINIDAKGADLLSYEKIKPFIDKNKYYSVQVTEKYYSLITLDRYLKEYPLNLSIFKSIIYQAVNVLHQIGISYPNFRHNHFFPETINCYLKDKNGIVYPELKLGDFYLAEIKEIANNKYLRSGEINIPKIDSSYGDLYQLLNYLWKNKNSEIIKYSELVALFDIILPKKIRSDEPYLSVNLWNSLSEDEKYDLRIKNIRDQDFFKDKDMLKDSTFLEHQIDSSMENDSMGGRNKKNSNKQNAVMEDERSEFEDKTIPVVRKENVKSKIFSNENTNDDNKNIVKRTESEIEKNNKNIGDKKYSNDDIGAMSHKKTKKNIHITDRYEKNKKNSINKLITDDIDETVSETTEKTEEKVISKPSRIINVTESMNTKRIPKNKSKTYRGSRKIINSINIPTELGSLMRDLNLRKENQIPYDNQQYVYQNGIQSRINSIGNMLGATPYDFNRQPLSNYGQISQQMAQQYQYDNGHNLPSNIPPNIPSQVPLPIQNPIGQSNNQQIDNDAIYRYLAASNQLGQQNQTQVDPNLIASYLAQQNAQIPYQQNGQSIYQQPIQSSQHSLQMGGSKNPFFFQ